MARKKKVLAKAPARKGKAKKVATASRKAGTRHGKRETVDLTRLRKAALEARASLEAARKEAGALAEKAKALVAGAKGVYSQAVAPYRIACRKAGKKCEFTGGRSSNVSPKVSFEVEKTKKGIRVMVKGQPKTAEVIPFATLKNSVNREAYRYTDTHLGPRTAVGNKGGSLSNRLRAALAS